MIEDVINPVDGGALHEQMQRARPFRFCCIDEFLRDDFARQVEDAFPTIEVARRDGFSFDRVNERNKVQVTNAAKFPEPLARLNAALASPEWLARVSEITGISGLLADRRLEGGGMQQMGADGYLDPHVDFGILGGRRLFRRLNILVYFNRDWATDWGGELELWDPRVRQRVRALAPLANRCVIFATTARSFHGVALVRCPPQRARRSFAAYYYTTDPAPEWNGLLRSTSFRARPGEPLKRYVLMPAERAADVLRGGYRRTSRGFAGVLARASWRSRPPPSR